MSSLCRRLDELWEENQGVEILFTWIQFLKETALDFLGIQSPLLVVRGGSKAHSEHRETDPTVTGTVCLTILLVSCSCNYILEKRAEVLSGVTSWTH